MRRQNRILLGIKRKIDGQGMANAIVDLDNDGHVDLFTKSSNKEFTGEKKDLRSLMGSHIPFRTLPRHHI